MKNGYRGMNMTPMGMSRDEKLREKVAENFLLKKSMVYVS